MMSDITLDDPDSKARINHLSFRIRGFQHLHILHRLRTAFFGVLQTSDNGVTLSNLRLLEQAQSLL
jgi:hypothetical protein